MQQQPTHITLPKEYLDALMDKICSLENTIKNIEAKTDNIHRLFNQHPEPVVKKLTSKQKIEAEIKRQIDAEKLSMVKKVNQS